MYTRISCVLVNLNVSHAFALLIFQPVCSARPLITQKRRNVPLIICIWGVYIRHLPRRRRNIASLGLDERTVIKMTVLGSGYTP